MGPRLFRPRNAESRRALRGFNGAAVCQTAEFAPSCQPFCRSYRLQWGRGFSDRGMPGVEGDVPAVWLQWGRGFSTAEMNCRRDQAAPIGTGFNGAAVFQTAESNFGNAVWCWSGFNGAAVFQAAESRRDLHAVSHKASMGPRSFRPRNALDRTFLVTGHRFNGAAVFQTAEYNACPQRRTFVTFSLQWGRGLSDRGGRDGGLCQLLLRNRFNGAAVFQTAE